VLDKKFFTLYGKWKVSSPLSQQPATCPYREPDPISQWLPTALLKIQFNIIIVLFPQVSASKSCMHLSNSSQLPHAPPVSFILI